MMRRLALGTGLLLSACLFTDLDGLSTGTPTGAGDGGSDAGSLAPATLTDAAAIQDGGVDAQEAAAPTCQNLILNAGFEEKASCDPWTSGNATVSDVAHQGLRACQTCSTGSVNIHTTLNQKFVAGDRLRLSVWMRVPDTNDPLYAKSVAITAGSLIDGNSVGGKLTSIVLSTEYQQVVTEALFPDAGSEQIANLQMYALEPQGCVVFDDPIACRY